MTAKIGFLLLLAAFGRAADLNPGWRVQYFFDEVQATFEVRDLTFMSPERGVAVGIVERQNKKPSGMSVVTRDGGKTWTELPLPDIPVSVFFLNDSEGWLVTEKGLWSTNESGRNWKRIRSLKGVRRVHFLDSSHGFMTGAPKLFEETKDGGKTWTPVAGVADIPGAAENTYFDWIEWVNARQAIVLGANVAPRRGDRATWMDPEDLARRKEWPGMNISLETKDGGATWSPQTVPTFGRFHRFKKAPQLAAALILIRFVNTFQYPSEVYQLDKQGKMNRVFRDQSRNVTDVGWVGGTALLATVQPVGKLHQLPIPGRVHVLSSPDLKTWSEMKVDYRANAQNVLMATSGESAWIATDTGMILKLEK